MTAVTVAEDQPGKESKGMRLGSEIKVTVNDYSKFRKSAADAGKPITLFLDGIDSGIAASRDLRDTGEFAFILTRDADNLSLWRRLLREPFRRKPESVAVSVGIKGGQALARQGANTNVTLLKKHWPPFVGIFWTIFLLLVLAGILFLARNILKNEHNQRYSLGRTQLAWWFLLILGSYILIWLFTGDRDTITGSVLVLLGISAATTAASSAINATVPQRRAEKLAELAKQKTAAPETAPIVDQEVQRIVEAEDKSEKARFPYDLICDDDGRPALHRYQIVVWTLVLGVFFVYSVFVDLTMPQFSDTLLALMGISAGTYIGVKAPNVV